MRLLVFFAEFLASGKVPARGGGRGRKAGAAAGKKMLSLGDSVGPVPDIAGRLAWEMGLKTRTIY